MTDYAFSKESVADLLRYLAGDGDLEVTIDGKAYRPSGVSVLQELATRVAAGEPVPWDAPLRGLDWWDDEDSFPQYRDLAAAVRVAIANSDPSGLVGLGYSVAWGTR